MSISRETINSIGQMWHVISKAADTANDRETLRAIKSIAKQFDSVCGNITSDVREEEHPLILRLENTIRVSRNQYSASYVERKELFKLAGL